MTPLDLSPPEPLAPTHGVDRFDSGEPSLDSWLKTRALKNQTSGASRCFVVRAGDDVVGYYCLSAATVGHEAAPKAMRRNMPDPLPMLLLGRLAVDRRLHNRGVGQALLRDAMLRATRIADEAGVSAILVHALSSGARQFYLSRGFVESPLQPMTLMMTLATVRTILAEPD